MLTPKKINPYQLPPTLLEKWPAEILDEGYTPFPKRLLRILGKVFNGPTAMRDVAAVLAVIDYRRPKLKHPPSVEYLAFIAGLTTSEMTDSLESMESRGLVACSGSLDAVSVDLSGLFNQIIQKSIV